MAAKKQIETGSKVRLVQYALKDRNRKSTNFDLKGEVVKADTLFLHIQYTGEDNIRVEPRSKWAENSRYWQKVWTLEVPLGEVCDDS